MSAHGPALRAGQHYVLTATVDRASLDERPDTERSGELETVVWNFYSPSGELTEPETAPTWLFVVATDETGGMSVTSVPLTIE